MSRKRNPFALRNSPRDKISQQQRIMFAREYVTDLNAQRAAIACGLNPKRASAILRHPQVDGMLKYLQEERAFRLSIKADNVLKEIARLAFSNMKDYIAVQPDGSIEIDFSDLTTDQTAAVQEISMTEGDDTKTVRFKLADKRASLELLGRYLKLFDDGASKKPTQIQIINLVPRPNGDSNAITI
jgi:phage terminase small subunit